MPALFIYLIKVNVALLVFCLGYYAVLRHLTFYTLNRIYLVTAILFATLYPFVNLTAFLSRHGEIAKPIQVAVINWQAPVNKLTDSVTRHDQWYWLQMAFWAGVIIFAIRLATQLLSLYRLHKQSEPAQVQHYMIRVIKGNINPFSFWRNIYINPENHASHELDAILEHEQIHVNEWHTLDILLGEVSAIFYWFNPGIWLMKRAIRENIEFITDRKILQKGMDCKTYQYSLINVNFNVQGNPIVNHFNISTIKKRIIMMNAKRSSSVNLTRYVLLLPVVVGLLLVFSVSKAELRDVSKSSKHMMKILKTVVTKINFNFNDNSNIAAVHKTADLLKAVSINSIQTDTLPETKLTLTADTNKKSRIAVTVLGTGANPVYYIDGVKATKEDFNNIAPDKIAAVYVYKKSNATNADEKNGIVSIVTKQNQDSEKVKALLEKLNISMKTDSLGAITIRNLNGSSVANTITKIKLNGNVYVPASGADVHTITGNGNYSFTYTDTAKKNGHVTVSSVRVNGRPMGGGGRGRYTDSVVNGRPGTVIYVTPDGNVKRDSALREVMVTGHATSPARIMNLLTVSGRQPYNNAPIQLTDKLIIIDGKEATAKEMKKLSVDKIESISNFSGEGAINKYGEKAKNGAVVITTKK